MNEKHNAEKIKPLINNKFVYPNPGIIGNCFDFLLNFKPILSLRRLICSILPFPKMESDVKDVIYLTWVVKVEDVINLVPPGVTLWEKDGKTLFTVLTYSHSNFGPSFLRPLRKFFPSPLQSNWRLYVKELPNNKKSDKVVLFVKNVINSTFYAATSRLLSDALPSHLPAKFIHDKNKTSFRTEISKGIGSSPEFKSLTHKSGNWDLPPEFESLFESSLEAIEFLTIQNSAICNIAGSNKIAQAGIELPIDINSVQPLTPDPRSNYGIFLKNIGAVNTPFSFRVPNVKFRVLWEKRI